MKVTPNNILRALVSETLVVNAKDESVLVRVPAGEFELGDGKDTDCPAHKVWVGEYWIGVYCVTNGQYGRFVKETGHREPDNQIWKEAAKRDHPVVNVSWDDCVAYGKWAGLELPTEAQWEKAARGPLGMIYPWGYEWDGTRCENAVGKSGKGTSEVGGYPQGVSGYGTYQQSGNVWEWCADWYDTDYYKKSPARDPRGAETGSVRVIRGGGGGGRRCVDLPGCVPGRERPRQPPRPPGFSPREEESMKVLASSSTRTLRWPCLPVGGRGALWDGIRDTRYEIRDTRYEIRDADGMGSAAGCRGSGKALRRGRETAGGGEFFFGGVEMRDTSLPHPVSLPIRVISVISG